MVVGMMLEVVVVVVVALWILGARERSLGRGCSSASPFKRLGLASQRRGEQRQRQRYLFASCDGGLTVVIRAEHGSWCNCCCVLLSTVLLLLDALLHSGRLKYRCG